MRQCLVLFCFHFNWAIIFTYHRIAEGLSEILCNAQSKCSINASYYDEDDDEGLQEAQKVSCSQDLHCKPGSLPDPVGKWKSSCRKGHLRVVEED